MATLDLDQHRTPEGDVIKAPVASAPARILSPGVAQYFRAAIDRLNYLQYGDPAEYLLRMKGVEVPNSALDSIWVPPRFKRQNDPGDDIPLNTLLADPAQCLLVLGDPGCGKSTLARFLTCFFINRYRREEQDFFGLLVPLSTLQLSGMTYQEAVVNCAVKYVGLQADHYLIESIKASIANACIIFDGFDELPISQRTASEKESVPLRREAAKLIRALRYVETPHAAFENPLKSIVTSRIKDYYDDKESNLSAVPQYFISRFSPEQMNTAIWNWHESAKARAREHLKDSADILEVLNERRTGIQSALRENFDLATVCLTPLMLNVLQSVYSDAQDLPSSVSQLCWRAVNWFLVDKHVDTSQSAFVAENASWLRQTLVEIGWHIHERVVAGQGKSIDDTDLRRIAKSACPNKTLSTADFQTQEDAITRIASFIRRGHGILVKVSPGEFEFVHNVFREVMAGQALGKVPVPQRHGYALNELWHGPIRYWAGLRAREVDGLHEISAFVGELSPDVHAGNVSAVLARAEMLVEVCFIVPRNDFTLDLKARILEARNELCLLLEREDLHFAHRIRIGDLLGVLGNPKLERNFLDRVQWIEAGNRRIGREQNHRTRIAKYQTCPASPPTTGYLDRFGIGSYLVTNAEFRRFIDEGGYHKRNFWPCEIGWKWVSGEKETIQLLVKRSREVASTHLSSELAADRLVPDEIPERCRQMIERSLPLYWIDPAYNRPNQPVVGINWWEAIAYCLWLDEVLRETRSLPPDQHVRLPIEAEWETAARLCGNDNIYPWINGLPADSAHVGRPFDSSVNPPVFRSCAVGLFRSIATNLPIFDLVGNVWEWTASKAAPYTNQSFDQTLALQGLDDRISRGSSWLSSEEESTQVTFRSFDPPYNAYEDLGFRMAIGRGGPIHA